VQPDEILVLNDGSTDDTLACLEKYQDRVMVLSQKNSGVACARNRLVQAAGGDMLAFLDADDIWHMQYLETQRRVILKHPEVVASFTGHLDFPSNGMPDWSQVEVNAEAEPAIFDPVSFLYTYNTATGIFGSPSFCCLRKAGLGKIPGVLIHPEMNGTDDVYLFHRLGLRGPVALLATKLAAYRLTKGSLSANRLTNNGLCVRAFELLEAEYKREASPELMRAFRMGFSAKRRVYARTLLGVGKAGEARRQLCLSLLNTWDLKSSAKSLGLLLLSLVPKQLQPRWPSSERAVNHARNQTGLNERVLSGK
jgi:glycosyltransferase involved in cell wall biosynthesis